MAGALTAPAATPATTGQRAVARPAPIAKSTPVRRDSPGAVVRPIAVRVKGRAVPSQATQPKRRRVRRVYNSRWKEPNYADSTIGDNVDGEDLAVRRAAVEALGPYNGTVAVVDPDSGRVLTIVNQKLAFKGGFQPCSTIKVVVGMAALSDGIVERTTRLKLSRRVRMDLTEALAKSNNPYFAKLGQQMGFERVSYYARLFGLGEKALLGVDEEQPGQLPAAPPQNGGVGMMSSFGEGITLTPLQLAAMLSALANGGTLPYLQYPRSQEEAANFTPRFKRQLDVAPWINEVKPGMLGAVEYGTARRAAYSPDEPILGKTGTCTDRQNPTHLGWFGSFNEVERNKLVVVVLLTGGSRASGPAASGVAGELYRRLSEIRYFAQNRPMSPIALVGFQKCCLQ